MSNRHLLFFLASILTAGSPSFCSLASPQDSLFDQANKDFLYENFQSAVRNYSMLVEQGKDDEQLFYRLAFLHEQLQQYPEAVFYLRKLNWHTKDPLIDEKLVSLLERPDRSIAAGDPPSPWTLHLVRHVWWWVGGIAAIFLLAIGILLLRSWQYNTHLSLALGSAGLLAALLFLLTLQLYIPRGVIVVPTYFYESPSYGAGRVSWPLQAGSVVRLLEEKDIWQKVSANDQEAWVPAFVLAPLEEWQ